MTDLSKMTSPKEALEEAKRLYDLLALGPLDMAAKYGPDFEPPTNEEYLGMRHMIEAAIPIAELHEQAVELLKENPNRAIPGKPPLDWFTKRDALLDQLEALRRK